MGLNRLLGDLAHNLDSAAVGSYQGKSSFGTIAYSSLSGTPSVVFDSSLSSQFVDSAYIQARQLPGLSGLDSASAISVVDSDYINLRIGGGGSGFFVYDFETTAGQTAIQDSDLNGNLMAYQQNGILVFKNGVLLLDSDDYTATDGSVVTLTSAAAAGSNITISKYVLGGGGGSASWFGDRAIFAGGVYSGSSRTNVMDYLDITTTGNATDFGDMPGSYSHISGASDATYGVYIGSYTGSGVSTDMYYITFSTTGNATDFGDVTLNYYWPFVGNVSNGTYGLYAGGMDYATSTLRNTIEYFTITSPANAADFGDMTIGKRRGACFSDATYGVFGGGLDNSSTSNVIDYVTIATPGNATDFGDLTVATQAFCGASDDTRGLFIGGIDGSSNNTISYVTIASPGNATDFGDLTVGGGSYQHGATSNSTRAVSGGGWASNVGGIQNTVQYVTIQTTGSSSDFGDLTQARSDVGALSGNAS